MKKAKFFLIISILVSLGFNNYPSRSIDKELQPYYDEFMEYVKVDCKKEDYFLPNQFIIEFGNPEKTHYMGQCARSNVRFIITLGRNAWDKGDEDDKASLMFHELTHCILMGEHEDDPKHYMNKYYTRITRQTVVNQVKSYIKEHCSKED